MPHDSIAVCPWPGDKRWVYSITFDEGLVELHRFAVPILDRYGVPGHLEVVAGHLGVVRNLGASSYNGYHHMGGPELREMLARGWGVGNHTWTHEIVRPDTVDLELGKAKEVIEAAIGQPISIYCSSGDNTNMSDHVLEGCRKYGFIAAMSITDGLNRPDDADLLWLDRTFLHTQGYGPFFSEFDPFRGLAYAKRERGWVIDYCHCPLEQAVHPNKDCSAAELEDRIATVCAEGGSDVWLANVDDAVDYRYTRRATKIEAVAKPAGAAANGASEYRISAPVLHPSVRRRTVTLQLPAGTWSATIDSRATPITRQGGRLLIDIDVSNPHTLRLN